VQLDLRVAPPFALHVGLLVSDGIVGKDAHIALSYARGQSLQELARGHDVRQNPYPPTEVIQLLRQNQTTA
jgi:hypothetical protein